MAQSPKKPERPSPVSAAGGMPRRISPRKQREQRRQRLIITIAGAAVGLALLAILVGVLYDQVFVPSQPVAQVGGTTLSRSDYWRERRGDNAYNISQSLFLMTYSAQFAQQVLGQISSLDAAIPLLQTEPIDETAVSNWTERQLILQGARQFNIEVSDGEVAQALDASFGPDFGPLVTNTLDMTPTATLVPSATPPPTETPLPTVEGQPTATSGPTMTAAPTQTPPPTLTPTVTPPADQALSRQDTIYTTIYDQYVQQLAQVDPQRRAQLTLDDFKYGLYTQFQRQVFTTKIQEQLVPDAGFTPTTDPSAIDTRHILLKVTVPVTATEEQREAAYAARRPEAEALLAQIRGGADFEALARETSEDYTTKDAGGTLPAFDKEGKTQQGTQVDPAYVAAVSSLQENQVSELVRTPFGWHIIQLVKRTVDTREQQLQAARTTAFDEWLNQQRSTVSVQRFPAVSPSPTALPTGTALPLPTAVLGGEPSPTAIPTPGTPGTAAPAETAAVTVTPATPSPAVTATAAMTATASPAATATAAATATLGATATLTPAP